MEETRPQTALEDALSGALDAIEGAVLVLDDDQQVLFGNAGAARILRCSSNELHGRPLAQFFSEALSVALAGVTSNAETLSHPHGDPASSRPNPEGWRCLKVRRADGSETTAAGRISRLLTPGGRQLRILFLREEAGQQETQGPAELSPHLFGQIDWGVAVADRDTETLQLVNPAFAAMHGYTVEELAGKPLRELIAPGTCEEELRKIRASGAALHRPFQCEHLRKDGARLPILTTVAAVPDDAGLSRRWVISVQDLTESLQAHEALKERFAQREKELSTLLEVARDIASMLELQPLLTTVLDRLGQIIEYTGAVIAVLVDDELKPADYRGPLPRDLVLATTIPSEPRSCYWRVVARGRPAIVDDLTREAAFISVPNDAGEMDLRSLSSGAQSWLGVPLLVQGRVIGVLGLYHAARAGFSERDAGMAVALANAVAAAIDNVRAHEQAQRQATLSERQRLSRELHDSVLQGLYGISLGASSALKLLEASPADAVRPLQYIQALAQSGLAETRAIIHDLRPTTERVEGVIAALTRQAVALGANYELRVDSAPCDDASLPPEIRAALYGILREALHNVNKHARATEVDVRLACQDGHVSLLVQDNGDGFDLDGAFPGHLGLRSMRERAETLGGSLSVESTPGSGTRIHAILPLAHGA